ncbi:MAG: glycogen/starch/alpha-glucan phosphorylase [Erysipelotrichaceae bacterium]
MQLEKTLTDLLGKNIKDSTDSEIYLALLKLVDDMVKSKPDIKKEKKLYYISAEFLIGKLLSNNLINLGIYQEIRGILENNGKDLASIEEIENEPSLGNGGLGRLAACFLDSIATLGLNGDGVGLNYHFGLFKQEYKNNKQYEVKNEWITPNSWLKPTDISFEVPFKDLTVKSVLYDIDVVGYNNGVNSLRLFDIETVDESVVKKGINFDPTDIEKVLTLFLYPDDSTEEGKLLRIYQQYFMVSNAAQLIIHDEKQKGHNLRKLHKHVAVQINDTHPTLVIPELIRLLSKEGIEMKEAIRIVTKTCAYTNHTILSEALEKWPYEYLEKVCPHLMPIIEALDAVAHAKYNDPNVQIIDEERKVHMARICMHYSHSINGVAALHTEILKKSELKPFYKIYAEKFNNKTNGITFRRWLMHANYDLAQWLDSMIGTGWRTNAWDLQKLLYFHNDYNALEAIDLIKQKKKASLIKYIKERENVDIDPNSIFCIQIKRLHEYKRQQMNALYVIYKYLEIKNGNIPVRPITIIFGGKAAPAYTTAKNIIHLIKCLQSLIENDPEVSKHLKVIMVTNYNVSYAEKLIPACDISEQISLASKEASGTGNMKFMLNGAVTLGTIDGANVEIREQVGNENIFTFGESSDQVINHYNNHDYVAKHYYERPNIKRLVDFIDNPEVVKYGDIKCLQDLKNELINKDWFMTLLDLESYINTKEHAFSRFEDRLSWRKMMLVNIAKAGFFSSDRTISEYNKDIWHLDKS